MLSDFFLTLSIGTTLLECYGPLRREMKINAGTAVQFAFDYNLSAVQFHQALDDMQPQTRARMALVLLAINLMERLGDLVDLLIGDAYSFVLNGYNDTTVITDSSR